MTDQVPQDPAIPTGAVTGGASLVSESIVNGIGGRRGLLDSGLPTAVFVVVYLATGSELMPSVWAALGAGVVVVIVRSVRREPLQQIFVGFCGVAISAFLAARTGRAEDFFLPGLLVNAVYGAAFAGSALVNRPLLGYAAGALTQDLTSWRDDPASLRAAGAATWLWAAMFGLRLVVQVPLFLAGMVGALGVAKLVMGWPLYLFAAYLSYRILRGVLPGGRATSQTDD